MEKYNGCKIKFCEDVHDLEVYFDESCGQFFAYCKKCGLTSVLSVERLDEVFNGL